MPAKNKTAIVTGAGQGIGRGIALAMAQAGYNVVVSDVNQVNAAAVAAELQNLKIGAVAMVCDVSKKSEVEAMFKQTVEQFGNLDVLVNNAGIYPFVPFAKMSELDWDKVMSVNLKSIFLTSQAAAAIMPEGGRIINISSIASLVGFEGLTHYCASKGGINGFSRALALELAHKKITVNVVAPGAISTPGAAQTDQKILQQTIGMIPLSRMGQPEDIANAVVFLADEKSNYITGQVIVVDGGWTLR
jgi:NAD(P)-dependent dehydrogenase (short-subunit alcohol dehydrogenase family)